MANNVSFIERSQKVADSAFVLYRATLMGGGEYPEVDYLSVYTHTEEEKVNYNKQAAQLGELVAQKNGNVYLLEDSTRDLPTNVVRVREADPIDPLIGGVDLVIPRGVSYQDLQRHLIGREGYFNKFVGPQEYQVCGLRDENLAVSIAFASKRITEKVMGLGPSA